ncbi:hypothetical protein JCM10449v2_008234 [Rhodotorula kratochvilovae]
MSSPPPAPSLLSLPSFALQPSLSHVIADIARPDSSIAAEHAWVSAYASDEAVHARLRVSEGEHPGQVDVEPEEGGRIAVEMRSHSEFFLSCPTLSLPPTTVLLPSPRLNPSLPAPSLNPTSQESPAPSFLAPRGGTVDCLALAPNGRRLALGGRDGHARVVELAQFADGGLRAGRETLLRGHVGDVVACEFAPSGEVVLTASSDMTVRVFSALDGSSPRLAPIPPLRPSALFPLVSPPSPTAPHKGRHVLTSSLSGTLTLLDLSPSPPLALQRWALPAPITACAVLLRPEKESAREVKRGRYALAGCADGSVRLVPLTGAGAGRVLLRAPGSGGAVDALHAFPDPAKGGWTLALGTRTGVVAVFGVPAAALAEDAEEELLPRLAWRRAGSSAAGGRIHALVLSPRSATSSPSPAAASSRAQSVLVAPSSGLVYRASFEEEEEGVRVAEELVGLECEPALCVREDADGRVWVAGGGAVRVYERGVREGEV